MSELINIRDDHATIRWKLLTGVSALALTAYIASSGVTRAEDTDRPTLWIELGGQMDLLQGTSSPFTAPFMLKTPTPDPFRTDSPIDSQRPARFAFGADGKISFQPEDSDWIFSAGIRYGRSHSNRHVRHETAVQPPQPIVSGCLCSYYEYEAVTNASNEHHAVVDFSAGKDIGIGLFGHDGTSEVSAGARFAELATGSQLTIFARPKVTYENISPFAYFYPSKYTPGPDFHAYEMHALAERSFKGIGPSLSWNASTALVGNKQDGELALDWGINAAVLFGRQKAKIHHDTVDHEFYHYGKYHYRYYVQRYHHSYNPPARSRNVTVPDVGGFIGLSLKFPNSKVSFGYRGEIMFKAMDTGIDVAKKSNLTFNGPYASISVGVGD